MDLILVLLQQGIGGSLQSASAECLDLLPSPSPGPFFPLVQMPLVAEIGINGGVEHS